jgi:amino acid transporter
MGANDAVSAGKAATTESVAPKQYKRNASGLMRSVSAWDAFGISASNGVLGLGIAWILLYVPWLYTGANLYLSMLIAALIMLPVVLAYVKLATIYPRSGGEYVYASRVLHPAFGFAANACFVLGCCFYVGVGGAYVIGYGLAPMLQIAGVQFGKSSMIDAGTWLSGQVQTFAFGVVVICVFAVLLTNFATKVYYRAQSVLVIAGGVSLIAMALYGFFASRSGALANLDPLFSELGLGKASSLIAGSSPSFSLSQTYFSTTWPLVFLAVAFYGAYVGGEVKSPARSQMLGGLACLGFLTAMAILVIGGMSSLFGQPFFANLSNAMASSTFGLAAAPSFAALTSGAIGNGWVTIVLMLGFMTYPLIMVGAIIVLASRCILAWGLDRLLPDAVSRVSQRSHQPYVATWIVAAAAIVYAYFVSFGHLTAIAANWGFMIPAATAMVTAIVLPYRRKDVWRSSPGSRTWLGIPDVTLFGILGMGLVFTWVYRASFDLNMGVTPRHNFPQFIFFWVVYFAAIIIYFVASAIRSREGIDLRRN